jgi:hypothetical protein
MDISRKFATFAGAGLLAWAALAHADDRSADSASKDSSSKSASAVNGDSPPKGAGRPEDSEEDCD